MERSLIKSNLIRQIEFFWKNDFLATWERIDEYIDRAITAVDTTFSATQNKYYDRYGFSSYNSVQYCLFLYHLAHDIGNDAVDKDMTDLADQIYYLNKVMNSVDWYWQINLPHYFLCEHPIGTVLGRAQYGEYFCVYQGCTVGGSRKDGELFYPIIGNHVLMYSNSSIIGRCRIGDNVVVAADAKIINRDIPSNSLVMGTAKEIQIMPLTDQQWQDYVGVIWKG